MGEWQKIETAPKDGTKVDLWAKCWRAYNDSWEYQRFPDCWWYVPGHEANRRPHWQGLGDGWCPTHWQPLPEPPEVEPCSRCHGTRGLPCPVCLGAGEVVKRG